MKRIMSVFTVLVLLITFSCSVFAGYSYAAEIGDTAFSSIEAAMIVAENGDTVSILKDADYPVAISNVFGVTLNLNGHSINGGLSIENSILTITDVNTVDTGFVRATGTDPALSIKESAVTITSGHFFADEGYAVFSDGSSLTIQGGMFKGNLIAEDSFVTVTSGYFSDANVSALVPETSVFSNNNNTLTSSDYPYVVVDPSQSENDPFSTIEDIARIDDDFVCPACAAFNSFYAGDYGPLINNIEIVRLIYEVTHRMIHTLYKIIYSITNTF